MKKYIKALIAIFCVVITASCILLFSGFSTEIKVTANLNKMLSDPDMAVCSHTMFYAQKHPEQYHEILDLGEKAIGGLMKDFVAHPSNLRRQLIIDLVNDIARQEGLVSDEAAQAQYASNSDWFDAVGKNLYENVCLETLMPDILPQYPHKTSSPYALEHSSHNSAGICRHVETSSSATAINCAIVIVYLKRNLLSLR